MLIDCTCYGPGEYPTVLEALEENRVFSVKRQKGGRFRVQEECDRYYAAYLTPEQLRALGQELIEMAAEDDAA